MTHTSLFCAFQSRVYPANAIRNQKTDLLVLQLVKVSRGPGCDSLTLFLSQECSIGLNCANMKMETGVNFVLKCSQGFRRNLGYPRARHSYAESHCACLQSRLGKHTQPRRDQEITFIFAASQCQFPGDSNWTASGTHLPEPLLTFSRNSMLVSQEAYSTPLAVLKWSGPLLKANKII